jgi:hypothetical protein
VNQALLLLVLLLIELCVLSFSLLFLDPATAGA